MWGYNISGHGHKKYEDRIHKDSEIYGCIYPTTDVIFRNLARIAAGKPLILSDGIQGINGKSKWVGENFDHCFDVVGEKIDKLLSEFLHEEVEPKGEGLGIGWWY